MKLQKIVNQGEVIPKFYGIAYIDYMRDYAIAYPVPLNLFICFSRWLWHELTRLRKSKLDEMLTNAHRRGFYEGMKANEINVSFQDKDAIREIEDFLRNNASLG